MKSSLARALESLDTRVRGMSGRERLLLYAAVLLTPFLLIFQFAVVPQEQRLGEINERIDTTREEKQALQAEIHSLATEAEDPLEEFRERRRLAAEAADDIKQRLQATARDLLGPDRTAELLRELLAGRGNLELESLKRRSPETLSADEETGIRIRSHRIELELRGAYLDLLRQVRHLEDMPMLWLWGSSELTAAEGEPARLRLSLDAIDIDGLEDTP